MIRYFAIFSFFMATIFCFLINEEKICVNGLFTPNELIYIQQIDGTASDDANAFILLSLLNVVFAFLFAITTNKKIYLGLLIAYLIFAKISINLMLSIANPKALILDSIFICNDYGMMLWMVYFILFLISSAIFLIRQKI